MKKVRMLGSYSVDGKFYKDQAEYKQQDAKDVIEKLVLNKDYVLVEVKEVEVKEKAVEKSVDKKEVKEVK